MQKLYAIFVLLFVSLIPVKTLKIAPAEAKGEILATSTENLATGQISQINAIYVHEYIEKEAKIYGVNPLLATWIVSHESQDGRTMVGDDGICRDQKSPNFGKETQSLGYWMINNCYHPEVPKVCSMNLQCSTAWSLKHIVSGFVGEWTTFRFCRKLYKDCPL